MSLKLVEYVERAGISKMEVVYKQVAYGYDKMKPLANGSYGLKTVRKKVVNVNVSSGESIDFLNYLPETLVIQIGDTFYRKGGASFVYEYLNQSNDYRDSLSSDDMVISIMFNGGLLD